MLDDLLGPLPSYLERRAHSRIGKFAADTWTLSYAFSDGEEVIYVKGPFLSRLAEEAIVASLPPYTIRPAVFFRSN